MELNKNKLIFLFFILVFAILLFYNNYVKNFKSNVYSLIDTIEFQDKVKHKRITWIILQANNKTYKGESVKNISSNEYYFLLILNNTTNKHIAYRNAIKNGAGYIYDTSFGLNYFYFLNKIFSFKDSNDFGLIKSADSTPKIFNFYSHFGKPFIWLKSYSFTKMNLAFKNNYICGKRKPSYIQHALIKKKIETKIDVTSPSVQLPEEIYAPFLSMNTLYHYEAFWALYLPRTVEQRLTDIIRSLWSQKLLWLIDGTVSFNGVNSKRGQSLELKSLKEQDRAFLDDLVKFLFKWKCGYKKFYQCMIELSEKMAQNNFWDYKEVDYIKNWLNELTEIDYKEPQIVDVTKNKYSIQTSKEFDEKFYVFHRVKYTPKFQDKINDKFSDFKYLNEFCKLSNASLRFQKFYSNSSRKKSEISLVVSFNWQPIAQNIEIISAIYGSFFKHIVFCGPNMMEKIKALKKFESTAFIELNTIKGQFHYYCMTKAIELNLNTKGFLLMSDDVLLKYWKLEKFDINKIWFPFKLDCSKSYELSPNYVHYEEWGWWKSEIGLKALLNVWNYFSAMKKKNISNDIQIVENFLKFIERNSGPGAVKVCANFVSDIFYLPRSQFKPFHLISEIFRKFRVYVEIAVSTILAGLDNYENIEVLKGTYKCCGKFGMHLYNEMGVFGHAAKISKYNSSLEGKLFCELFIQDIVDKVY